MSKLKYYLSTIADVQAGEDCLSLRYENIAAPVARKYGLGLELAEFCITENLDAKRNDIMPHFLSNLQAIGDTVLHAPYNELLPHAIDPHVADTAYQRYRDIYSLCLEYGIPKMIVHANYLPLWYYPVWFIDKQVSFWRRFLSENPGGTRICLENVLEDDPSLLTAICEQVDDPRLGICLDVGHANLTPVAPEKWLEACMPYLSHMHVHNNAGLGRGPGQMSDTHSALPDGNIPMEKILRTVAASGKDITITLETSAMERSIEWLIEKELIP